MARAYKTGKNGERLYRFEVPTRDGWKVKWAEILEKETEDDALNALILKHTGKNLAIDEKAAKDLGYSKTRNSDKWLDKSGKEVKNPPRHGIKYIKYKGEAFPYYVLDGSNAGEVELYMMNAIAKELEKRGDKGVFGQADIEAKKWGESWDSKPIKNPITGAETPLSIAVNPMLGETIANVPGDFPATAMDMIRGVRDIGALGVDKLVDTWKGMMDGDKPDPAEDEGPGLISQAGDAAAHLADRYFGSTNNALYRLRDRPVDYGTMASVLPAGAGVALKGGGALARLTHGGDALLSDALSGAGEAMGKAATVVDPFTMAMQVPNLAISGTMGALDAVGERMVRGRTHDWGGRYPNQAVSPARQWVIDKLAREYGVLKTPNEWVARFALENGLFGEKAFQTGALGRFQFEHQGDMNRALNEATDAGVVINPQSVLSQLDNMPEEYIRNISPGGMAARDGWNQFANEARTSADWVADNSSFMNRTRINPIEAQRALQAHQAAMRAAWSGQGILPNNGYLKAMDRYREALRGALVNAVPEINNLKQSLWRAQDAEDVIGKWNQKTYGGWGFDVNMDYATKVAMSQIDPKLGVAAGITKSQLESAKHAAKKINYWNDMINDDFLDVMTRASAAWQKARVALLSGERSKYQGAYPREEEEEETTSLSQ